jgi:hypothetical protein
MDYFQSVVVAYLRANRATFVNTEYCIQVNAGPNPDTSGPHWYCDAVAVDITQKTCNLCEVSYSKTLGSLGKRLAQWRSHWPEIRAALFCDSGMGQDWTVLPHVFVPEHLGPTLERHPERFPEILGSGELIPNPKVTWLENVLPWTYKFWGRAGEGDA